jgi:hypothetical protein
MYETARARAKDKGEVVQRRRREERERERRDGPSFFVHAGRGEEQAGGRGRTAKRHRRERRGGTPWEDRRRGRGGKQSEVKVEVVR